MAFDPNKALVQDSTIQPLSRDAFIDPTTGAERPINNPVTNPINYASDVAKQEQNAIINRKIDAIAHDTTLTPEARQTQMANLQNQKTGMTGITPEMRAQIVAERDLPQNQYVPVRDIQAEQKNASKFGLDTTNPADVVSGLTTTYNTPQINKILLNGEVNTSAFSSQNLKDLGLTEDRIKQLMDQATTPEAKNRIQELYKKLNETGAKGMQAEADLASIQKPTNNKLNILSEVLNAKSNYKNQALGTSELFKAAGLSGYSVLEQSLNQRMQEMRDKRESALTVLTEQGGKWADAYKSVADNYKNIMDSYEKQTQMLLKIDETAKEHEFIMEKEAQQLKNSKELESYKASIKEKAAKAEAAAMADLFGDAGTIGGVKVDQKKWTDIFNVGGIGDWCGVFASKISTAPKVGNSWAEKRSKINTQTNPSMGDKLVIPIGVKTDSGSAPGEYGHVAVVVSYNPDTNTAVVVESNRDGRQNSGNAKGIITMGTYNLDKLKQQYGDDWGFVKGNLKTEYLDKIKSVLGDRATKEKQIATNVVKAASNFDLRQYADTTLSDVGKVVGGATASLAGAVSPSVPKSFASRYEQATGLKLTDAIAKQVSKMTPTGRENFLYNLEKTNDPELKAKQKQLLEAKTEKALNDLTTEEEDYFK